MRTALLLFLRTISAAGRVLAPVCPVSHSELFSIAERACGRGARAADILAGQVNFLAYRPASVAAVRASEWRPPQVCRTVMRPKAPDTAAYTKHHVRLAVAVQLARDTLHPHVATESSTSRR